MRKKSLLYHLALGMLVGILIMPPSVAHGQWTVYDPAQYTVQVTKKVEEANRWLQHYTNLANQLTTLGGVLKAADDLVAKQKNAIATMSNIGRTVRASFQLKDQLEAHGRQGSKKRLKNFFKRKIRNLMRKNAPPASRV